MSNKRLDLDYFLAKRQEVLKQWPTGSGVVLEDALAYHKSLPKNKVAAEILAQAKTQGKILIQPRGGSGMIDEHINLLRYLQDEGGADLLPTTIDSLTRQNRFEDVENAITASRSSGRSGLDGFPAVNYGVSACRSVVESVKVPCQVRHGTPDARLLAEIALAGGFSDFEGGGISYNIPYTKNVLLEQSIEYWQYVDRLVGLYEENGVKINREPFGALTGALIPPCISHSISIIEALLAAEQGVKYLTLGYGQGGNLNQDVAALQTLPELAEEYLRKTDNQGVMVTTVLHQWMGGFPQDESQAYGVISWGAVTAALAGSTKVLVKTPQEAIGVPTKEANAAGLKTTRQIINMLRDQGLLNSVELDNEKTMVRKETRAILDKVLELSEGDLAKGVVKAFQAGVLDVPFAPNRMNAGKMLPVRDSKGAVRILDHGCLPFSREIIEFHQQLIAERGRKEGRDPSFQMVVNDIYAIGKGRLVGSPS